MTRRQLLTNHLQEIAIFLPGGKITVGVTSGASTPDRVVGETIRALFEVANHGFADEEF
ncbi:hypothetical protein [Candidatus Synechococcus spongiarum]|uniref:hypothetical protein n=1 Tax=Candidatus Synechococcus spongiarum TaxID=431041 RepID=UPI0004B7D5C2|nr:hypothetical protein [Candidatus Synechococcus spongiarum]